MSFGLFFFALLTAIIALVGVIGYQARRDFGDLCFGVAFGFMSFWILIACEGAPGSTMISLALLMMALRSLCRAWDYRP